MKTTALLIASAALVLTSNRATAQNLVVNPDLTAGLAGWTVGNASGPGVSGSSSWDSDSGSSSSGSVRLLLNEGGSGSGGAAQTLSQCISALPAFPWDFGARRFVAVDSDGAGNQAFAAVVFTAFSNIGCSGSSAGLAFLDSPGSVVAGEVDGAPQNWGQLSGTVPSDPLPGGLPTASVRVLLTVQTTFSGDSINALYDAVFFGGDGTVPVELLEFVIDP